MASTISFGEANTGFQAGIITGPVNAQFYHHAPPERPETPPNPSIVIPFSRDTDFVERAILDQIYRKCAVLGSRTALVGLGGVGKSQLAIEYAYRVRDLSPETWVFWVHASNTARFEQSFQDIATCVKIPGRQNPQADILQLVHDWLCDDRKGKWVLILDNVDDASFLVEARRTGQDGQTSGIESGNLRSLVSYLPQCPHGSILITTRSEDEALNLVEQRDIITIEPMSSEDALKLFETKLGGHDEGSDNADVAAELLVALELLPLAIVQAAAYILRRKPRYSVREYLQSFRESDRKRTSLLDYNSQQLRRDREAKNSIIVTWQISFDYIRKIRPSAADLLSLMSFFDRQGIPDALLQNRSEQITSRQDQKESVASNCVDNDTGYSDSEEGGISQSSMSDRFEEDVSVLRNYSFISVNTNGTTFEIHGLVQLATRKWLEAQGEIERWKHQFLKNLDAELPTGEYENWERCQALFPHAQSAAAQRPQGQDSLLDWASILYSAAWYALKMGKGVEAENMAVHVMKVRKKILGDEHSDTLNGMAMVGSAYSLNGRWDAAEKLQVQVMETRKTKLGVNHPDTRTSMANLALTYRNQGRWDDAEKLEVQVMETRKTKLGVDHPSTLMSMANLASTYRNQGWWDDAEKLEVQVMETRKTKLGVDHPSTLISMANLASTLWNQGRWDDAEKLEMQVMETRKTKLGVDHPSTLTSMANLASTYRNQGRWDDAEKLEVQVMETRKRVLGAEHPFTLTSMATLASTFWNQSRWNEAEKLDVQVMETRKRVLGADHPDTLTSMANLASTYRNQGRWDAAEDLEVQVMETSKKKLGADHPSTLTSMANLASTYSELGRWDAAEELFVQVIETSEKKLGAGHPSTLSSMANLASTYSNQGRWDAAEELFVQVIETNKRVLGVEYPSTLSSMTNLALIYKSQDRWKEAEELEVQVTEISKKLLGTDHPSTLTSISNFALTYRNQGRRKKAEELDEAETTSTEHRSAFWSEQARSTNPSSLSQIAVDMEQVVDSRLPMTFYRYKPSADELKLDERDSDIQSVESIPGDIDSLAESTSGIIYYQQAAVNYIVKVFTDDLELLALYQEATHCMDEAKFVKNNRRLLKRLFLDLRDEGHGASQKLAVRFLRSRSKRTHISSEIHRLLVPSEHTVREKVNLMLKQEQGNLSLLDRFLNERDSAAQEAPTSVASQTSDCEPLMQPQVRDEQSEESEDEDDENMSGDQSEIEIEDDGIPSKLAATAKFLISGRPFHLYKQNLRAFIQPVHPASDLEENLRTRRTKESETLDLDYDIIVPKGFILSLQDMWKTGIEHLAGCQLSWWPLAEPEDTLRSDHIRVYSMPFRGRRFYDDIPAPLAESLFSKLSSDRASTSEYSGRFLGREAVLLHNTTLMRLLFIHFTSKSDMDTAEQYKQAGQGDAMNGHARSAAEPMYSSSGSRHGEVSLTISGASTTNQISLPAGRSKKKLKKRRPQKAAPDSGVIDTPHDEDGQENPVLFFSVYTGLNESIARTVVPGTTDKATFQRLYEAYRSVSSGWFRLKRATGIKFFRFHSFLFKETLSFYYVDIHRDKERYPGVGDPEFEDYRYRPRPWPLETSFPSHEVWHYFVHPEDCGTSTELKEMLPMRFKGPILSRSRAFGVHIEERYSALAIFIPAFFMFLLTLAATLWFIPNWLREHPDDLQNATVPITVAFAVAGVFIQLSLSLIIFRWTSM